MLSLRERSVPVMGELELGYENSLCLVIAVTGTNGKTTTTELVGGMLREAQCRVEVAGNIGRPVCDVAALTRDLEWLVLEVSSFQLEAIRYFRPVIGVCLSLTPDHLDRHATFEGYVRAKGRMFENQQPWDWAVVESRALETFRKYGIRLSGKIITISATDTGADLYQDRGLLVSRLSGWAGPLIDMENCRLRGPHNAENLLAALAVARILRLPLPSVKSALQAFAPAAHRCETILEWRGIRFVNDSKATNVDAVRQALRTVPRSAGPDPCIWLIAGGRDKGLDFHELGPDLSGRVCCVLLIGEAREKLRAAWSLFAPCEPVDSLEAAVDRAVQEARPGQTVLFSPGCASFDMFRDYQQRGEAFAAAVRRGTQSGVSDESFSTSNPNTAQHQ